MTLFDREFLFRQLEASGASEWADTLRQQCVRAIDPETHGDLTAWIEAWNQLPVIPNTCVRVSSSAVEVRFPDAAQQLSDSQQMELTAALRRFHPWRKGPFDVLGVRIDTEWRSDMKWNRFADAIDIRGHMVLDVGCGNGYYGWRMVSAGAKLVCGLDPMLLFVMQYEVIRKYAARCVTAAASNSPLLNAEPDDTRSDAEDGVRNVVLPVGDDVLTGPLKVFDTVFSMGVLYHRTSPVDHLLSLRNALRPGGQLLLETLVIDDRTATVLVPEKRYARMRNVWFIPSISMLLLWLNRTGFRECRVLDLSVTTTEEQRQTDWMTFESLSECLDPTDPGRTVEGYPAPRRVVIAAGIP